MLEILRGENIKKSYRSGDTIQKVLNGVNVKFERGKLYCITGASGSGKSTLLYILSGLDMPDQGEIYFNDEKIYKKYSNDKAMSEFRRKNFAFIFQFFNLLPTLTVEENILLPLFLAKAVTKEKKKLMDELMEKMNIYDKRNKAVNLLSGGEQQRVSIARAMILDCPIIFADEPTGNLDHKNSLQIYSLLKQMTRDYNKTVISVTHDMEMTSMADVIFTLKDGILIKSLAERENKNNYN
ncbi:ABC transporter ATP-binding protein [Defluviitalea phaphyphila]|uniref:ABC transporter ATP-binding protein n=1 Tax=Defluviitalea phaphyphila TaxID=1473580 RepID=UPI0007302BFB|nr:ABC transporter ATP-binding protein [Defluviitalea phaphyphila]